MSILPSSILNSPVLTNGRLEIEGMLNVGWTGQKRRALVEAGLGDSIEGMPKRARSSMMSDPERATTCEEQEIGRQDEENGAEPDPLYSTRPKESPSQKDM